MVNIQFVQKEQPTKNPQNQSSAFHWQGQKQSPYMREGQPLTWLQVQELVGEIMKERDITLPSKGNYNSFHHYNPTKKLAVFMKDITVA